MAGNTLMDVIVALILVAMLVSGGYSWHTYNYNNGLYMGGGSIILLLILIVLLLMGRI